MSLRILSAFVVFALAVSAQQQCVLTGEPRLLRAEGLAEPVGELLIQCGGAPPAQLVTGVLQVTLDSRIGNRLDAGLLQGVVLSQRTGNSWQALPAAARSSGNAAVFESLSFSYDAQGQLALRVSGLRAQGQPEVRAFVSFLATPALPLPTPIVLVGKGETSLLSGFVNGNLSALTVRVTENVASAFGGPADTGLRLLVRYPNVPAGVTVFVPNAIAGSSAAAPTSAGAMSLPNSSGAWQSGTPSLLLTRIDGANAQGAGGAPAFTPQPGLNQLDGATAPAARDGDTPYAVYEVITADPAQLEFAEIPTHFGFPTGWQGRLGVVRPTAQLAPLSAAPGPTETLPVPRFLAAPVPTDCHRLNDCRAAYFPSLTVFLNGGTLPSVEVPAESTSRNQYIGIRNYGSSLAEWRVAVRYRQGAGWLKIQDGAGIDNATAAWFYDTRGLAPGRYEADLAVQITNGPRDLVNEQLIPLALTVTPAVQPPKPEPPKPEPPKPEPGRPVIRDVVSPATGYGGPVAPASLLLIKGESFQERSAVLVDRRPAVILQRSASELLIETPLQLTPGAYVGLMVEQDGVFSGVWGLDIAAVAPAILQADNEDGLRNSAAQPAVTGTNLRLPVIGIRLAAGLTVRIHDRATGDIRRVELDPAPAGVDVISFLIPEDLPAMSTAVTVCATAGEGAPPVCSEPFEVFLRKP